MTRVTGRMESWVGAAVLPALLWGCTNTVRPIDPRPDDIPSSSTGGRGGGSLADGCGTGGTSGTFIGGLMTPGGPVLGATVVLDSSPVPISGGTLLLLDDHATALAADPDRDRVYVVDVTSGTVSATVSLQAGDQPGRLVQDGAGHVHVVLRGAGAIATIDPVAGQVTMRRSACSTPRGIAYAASSDLLYLACASGQLMTFTPTGATPASTWMLDQDLRDVIVDGDALLVTRFRSAEVLQVDPATGTITDRQRPPTFSNGLVHQGATFEPVIAWRAAALPGGGMVMAHQRGMYDMISPSPGGYGAGALDPCGTIVHSCVTKMKRGAPPEAAPAFPGFVLPVDIAVSPNGDKVAVVAAGNGHAAIGDARRLFIGRTDEVTQEWGNGCGMDDIHGPSPSGACFRSGSGGMPGSLFPGTGGEPGRAPVASGGVTGAGTGGQGGVSPIVGFCAPDPITDGEPIAVAFADETTVLVQIREPAELLILRQMSGGNGTTVTVPLSSASRANTGHELFHANSGGGLACASCHPEGHDDGRIWNFQCEGPRRTQDPSGGLVGTAPYHWSGDLPDFTALVQEVYVRRMSGPVLNDAQANALQSWLNTVPELPPLHPSGDSQVAHGKVLFESPSVGCVACHSGPAYTNNMTVSVGTGAPFQVPALHGVGWRAPYMHNGCAATLLARFTDPKCGGGDLHGVTSNLSDADRADLIAYLQSL